MACNCLECRLRAALSGQGKPEQPFDVDVGEAITAMGNVMSELLAHVPSKSAKRFSAELMVARKKWLDHPRVATQHPKGSA
ncbi:hypothetical protein ACMYR2_2347 [Nitrobacter sp. TKz-YC01]